MIKGEMGCDKLKAEIAQKAKAVGLEELYTFIDNAFRDEARYESMLNRL